MRKAALFAIALCASLAGCAASGPAVNLHAGSAQLRASVSPAVAGEANVIEICSDDLRVAAIVLDMPDMQMPPKSHVLIERGPHVYETTNVTFSMAGTWRARLLDPNGAQIASFTIAVR